MLKRNVSGRSKTQRVKRSREREGAALVARFHARLRAMPRQRQAANRDRRGRRHVRISRKRAAEGT